MIKFIIERVSIMNDIGLLNLIQKLHLGELIDDECLATFLEQQECYFLLSKMPSQKNRIISYLIVNQMRIIPKNLLPDQISDPIRKYLPVPFGGM